MDSSLPKYYQNVNVQNPNDYSNYNQLQIVWGEICNYRVSKKIGRGKYSDVFEGFDHQSNIPIVAKILKPVKKRKIYREVKILLNLQDGPNIIKLLDIVKDPISKTPSLIFEHVQANDYKQLFPTLTDFEIRFYIYEVLKALDFAHSKGIIHRDVKPQNLVIDHSQRKLRLIDWGLAEFYFPYREYNVRVASRYYKGPELLVDEQFYHYSLDMWSLGTMLATILFKRDPFFYGQDNQDQLVKIAKILGTDELMQYLQKYDLTLDSNFERLLRRYPKIPWKKFINRENKEIANCDALDFLDKCLLYDHDLRIAPIDAMQHQYMQPVVRLYENIKNGQNPYDEGSPEWETARIILSR